MLPSALSYPKLRAFPSALCMGDGRRTKSTTEGVTDHGKVHSAVQAVRL
jgi:hypothetical protein